MKLIWGIESKNTNSRRDDFVHKLHTQKKNTRMIFSLLLFLMEWNEMDKNQV